MTDVTFVGMGNATIRRATGKVEEIMVAIVADAGWPTIMWPEGTVLVNGDTLCIPEHEINWMVAA